MTAEHALRKLIEQRLPRLLPVQSDLPILVPIDTGFATRARRVIARVTVPYALETLLTEINDLLGRCMALDRHKTELEEKAVSYFLSHVRDLELTTKRRELAKRELDYDQQSLAEERAIALRCLPVIEGVRDQKQLAVDWRDSAHPVAVQRTELNKVVTGYLSPNATEAVQPLAQDLELNRLQYEKLSAEADTKVAQAEVHRASGSETLLGFRESYLSDKRKLLMEQIDLELAAISRRENAATDPSSPLNYARRIVETTEMFDADFGAAIVRAEAISLGLSAIHGVRIPCPALSGSGMLFQYVVWARSASEALFSATEPGIGCSTSVSLKSKLSAIQWNDFVSGGETTATLVGADVLPAGKRGLLTGIRLEAKSSTASGIVPISVSPPPMPADDAPITFRCGDVLINDAFGRTGRASGRSLLNRAVVGEWKFSLHRPLVGVADCDVMLCLEMLAL